MAPTYNTYIIFFMLEQKKHQENIKDKMKNFREQLNAIQLRRQKKTKHQNIRYEMYRTKGTFGRVITLLFVLWLNVEERFCAIYCCPTLLTPNKMNFVYIACIQNTKFYGKSIDPYEKPTSRIDIWIYFVFLFSFYSIRFFFRSPILRRWQGITKWKIVMYIYIHSQSQSQSHTRAGIYCGFMIRCSVFIFIHCGSQCL